MTTATTTKERPILFSGAMVRAILDGRKTQTRRVCKEALMLPGSEQRGRLKAAPDASEWAAAVYPARDSGWIAWAPRDEPGLAEFTKKVYQHGFPCPYGQSGDRLWVRETWAHDAPDLDTARRAVECLDGGSYGPYYRATADEFDLASLRWRPSIHMPRWASRITLEVTGVRVERVQDISRADEAAEGVQPFRKDAPDELPEGTKFRAFSALWDSINEARGYGWAANPWVWVVEFKRVQP